MKKNIVLFLNHEPGLKVLEYLVNRESIVRVYVDDTESLYQQEIINQLELNGIDYYFNSAVKENNHISEFQLLDIDFIVCVYWPYLLKKDIFSIAKSGRINFHPALLPINRGWFPHVHSIIDGSPSGVTLHEIEEGADTGSIWVQKKIDVDPCDTAYSLYIKLQKEIVALFQDNWDDIKNLRIEPFAQPENIGNYHKKNEILNLDEIKYDNNYKASDLINLLRARSFGTKGFAYFIEKGRKIYLNISLSQTQNFD